MEFICVSDIHAIIHRASAVYDQGRGLSEQEIFHRMTATLARVLGGQLFLNRTAITNNTDDAFEFVFGVPALADLAGHLENEKLHDFTCKTVEKLNTDPDLIKMVVCSYLDIRVTVCKDFFARAEERRLKKIFVTSTRVF